jgi:hypothetical protein
MSHMTMYQVFLEFLCIEGGLYLSYYHSFKNQILDHILGLYEKYKGFEFHPVFTMFDNFVDIYTDEDTNDV